MPRAELEHARTGNSYQGDTVLFKALECSDQSPSVLLTATAAKISVSFIKCIVFQYFHSVLIYTDQKVEKCARLNSLRYIRPLADESTRFMMAILESLFK